MVQRADPRPRVLDRSSGVSTEHGEVSPTSPNGPRIFSPGIDYPYVADIKINPTPRYKRTSVFQLQAATRDTNESHLPIGTHLRVDASRVQLEAGSPSAWGINRFLISNPVGSIITVTETSAIKPLVRCRSCWVCGVASFETVFHVQYCSSPSSFARLQAAGDFESKYVTRAPKSSSPSFPPPPSTDERYV